MTLGWLSYGHYWQQHFGRGPFVCGWPSAKVPLFKKLVRVLAHCEIRLLFLLALTSNKLVVGGWIVSAWRLLSCYIVGKVLDAAACSCKQVQPRPFQTGNCISDITDDYKRF